MDKSKINSFMNRKIRSIGGLLLSHLPFGKSIVKYLRWRLFCVYKTRLIPNQAGILYKRNVEAGLMDTEIRDVDGIWEYPGMIVTNQVIGDKFLTNDIKSVVNIGSGVATFESLHAKTHKDVKFLACEMDQSSTDWAINNRPYPNVKYSTQNMTEILKNLGGSKFDMAITVDVIEHVADYKSFLDEFSMLADRAVISTPNRDMDIVLAHGPLYKYHVQEFNAGELYFILKMYYRNVELFSAPDPLKPKLVPVGLYSTYEKIYAYCEK